VNVAVTPVAAVNFTVRQNPEPSCDRDRHQRGEDQRVTREAGLAPSEPQPQLGNDIGGIGEG